MKRTLRLGLKTITCRSQTEGNGSEPYLWVNVLTASGTDLQFHAVSPARQDLAVNMKTGTSASIPAATGWWGMNFENDAEFNSLSAVVLLIALMEHDETPLAAIQKGRQAFDAEIRSKINIGTLLTIRGAQSDADREAIIAPIRDSVRNKVTSAIGSVLSVWDLIFKDLDISLGFGFAAFEQPFKPLDPISIRIQSDGNIFDVSGELRVSVVRPEICELEREHLRQTKTKMGDLIDRIHFLQARLGDASPVEKPWIIQQIRKQQEELELATTEHEAATAALQRCIDLHTVGPT